MTAVIAMTVVTSPLWLMLPLAVLGERTPKGAQIAERMAARMERL